MLFTVESAIALTPREFEAGTDGPAVSVLEGGAPRVDARLTPPPRAEGLVPRLRVVSRLLGARELPVALLVAPAGYGKTTVLTEWSEWDARPFAWVRLDGDDREPARLLASIAGALGVRTGASSLRPDATRRALARLLRHLAHREQPVVLVLDDLEALHGSAALPFVQAIADGMPAGSQLALASRHEPALAVGTLRAHRRLVEVRTGELAMARTEAADLLEAAGLHLGAAELTTVVRRTEGWPAGLYLAALSLRDDRDVPTAVSRFGGADRLVSDYLQDEFLTPLGHAQTAFLMRTSVLDTLSPAACDAILECSESGRTLAVLASSNALLVSLDRNGDSYRLHPLLAQMLRAELRRLDPLRERHLHRLASAWYGAQQEQGLAIRHAVAAGEVTAAGDLLSAEAPALIAHGRNDTVQSWLKEFSPEQIAGCAPLALAAANSRLAAGVGAEAEHWAAAAVSRMGDAPPRARGSLRAAALLPAAAAARDGLAGMRRDTARARELGPDDGPLISTCDLLDGVALHLTGDRDGARGFLAAGARGGAGSAPNVQALCLAQLGLLLVQDENWESAASLTTRARSKLELGGLGSYPSSALVFAVSGLVRAHRGMRDEARADTQRSSALVALLDDFAPWYQAETLLTLARAALRLGHLSEARTLTTEAESFVDETPDSPVLRDWIEESRAQLGAVARSAEKAWTLTSAELRVLRLLPTHLSFPAIAKSLFVSPNTVKTHVRAVYRKLDASSRAEAVSMAMDAGLLEAQRAA